MSSALLHILQDIRKLVSLCKNNSWWQVTHNIEMKYGNMKMTVRTAVCLQQQYFQPMSQSHTRCVIQWLLAEGDLCSTHPPALHNYTFTGLQYSCGQRVDWSTGWDTYRHHQLEGVLVHPHRWLVLLHHGGDYSDTYNLNNNRKISVRKHK